MLKLVRSPDGQGEHCFATNERRYAVLLAATLTFDIECNPAFVRICNISEGGLMAVARDLQVPIGHTTVKIPHIEELSGQIVWVRNSKFGIQLDKKIDPVIVLAERAAQVARSANDAVSFVNYAWQNLRPEPIIGSREYCLS